MTRNEGHFIMIKMPNHQQDIFILNTYASIKRVLKYTEQKKIELQE